MVGLLCTWHGPVLCKYRSKHTRYLTFSSSAVSPTIVHLLLKHLRFFRTNDVHVHNLAAGRIFRNGWGCHMCTAKPLAASFFQRQRLHVFCSPCKRDDLATPLATPIPETSQLSEAPHIHCTSGLRNWHDRPCTRRTLLRNM